MRLLYAVLALTTAWQPVKALEPENPTEHCERFLTGEPQADCEKRIERLNPDWYLAAVCSQTFDDKIFYQCIETQGSVSPTRLQSCANTDLSDSDRLDCVRKSLVRADRAFQSSERRPASMKPAHSKSKKARD
jgi:hypothetical protein